MILIVSIVSVFLCRIKTYAQQSVSVSNHFEKSVVDIEIKEYQNVNGREVAWEDNPTVLPGDYLSKIPRIYNHGADCYVRVKITFLEPGLFSEEHLLGMSDQWIKADDGCYYYKEVLKSGKTTDVFSGLEIQSDLPEELSEKTFHIKIDAEAVQSKNFTPDFTSDDPWEKAEIGDSDGTDSLIREPVETGDTAGWAIYAVSMGGSSFALLLLERKRKGACAGASKEIQK